MYHFPGLKIVKDIRPKLLAACCPKDDSECYAFRRKLQQEQERHSVTRSLLEKVNVELETCKKGLDRAEKERTEVLVYSTEVKALREELSAKEQEVLDLHEELSQRDQDLGLWDRLREGSFRGETPQKRCSCADTTLPNQQSFAQEVAQVHLHKDLQQESLLVQPCCFSILTDAQQKAERYDKPHLAGLQLGLQSSAEDANRDCIKVGETHTFETSQRELHHIDVALIPSGKTEEVDGAGTIDNAGLQSQNHAVACPQPDGVTIPDTIEPEQVFPQAVGQQSNSIPHLITAGPKIIPNQVGSHLEIVGNVASGHPSDNVSVPDVDLHQAAHQHLEDDISDGTQAAPPSGQFSSSNVVGQ
ncbi:hypothetical protein EDB85DRAFT_1898181 [Lactarius pseudohatsudake]|nr:hypothetical protein EDB85DRAFT_1898181 [Lactarius pseudohatsudake]